MESTLIKSLDVNNGDALRALSVALAASPRVLVLTGAGISAASGLPVYRNQQRQWQHQQPMQYQQFISSAERRQRYWIGSYLGWHKFSAAQPNAAHSTLAQWEQQQRFAWLGVVTQNVDGLHQQAGSQNVVDLHGRIDRVSCLDCGTNYPRVEIQHELEAVYGLPGSSGIFRPDGDVEPSDELLRDFVAPICQKCSGILKPDVVFFGENIPKEWKQTGEQWLANADMLIVVGSSLSVFSGLHYVREAKRQAKPVFCINQGETRGDELFDGKVTLPAEEVLSVL